MLPTFSQNLTLQQAFGTAAQVNEELKRMEFKGTFCKKLELETWKLVEKMIHQKKNRGHQTSRSLNPGKAIAMAICPKIVHFII